MFINCGEEFNRTHLARYKKTGLEGVIREYVTIQQILSMDNIDDFIFIDELLCLENLALIHICETVKRNVFELGIWSVDLSDKFDRLGGVDLTGEGVRFSPVGSPPPT